MGMVNASWPLVVLELVGGVLTLRIQPGLLAGAMGCRPIRVSVGGDAVVFPARGWFRSRFVGIRAGHRAGYFRTTRPEELPSTLQAAGFQVSWAEEAIAQL